MFTEQRLPKRTVALVLAGGRGTRLHGLTARRSKPAVYFGGKFRIIDFALSNCLNSGIRRISVITQYKSHSLLRHLQRGWHFLRPELNEFIDLLPAQQRMDDEKWYQGTADAVYQNIDIIRGQRPEYIVILAGDHVYKMDYSRMLSQHRSLGAPCTVACIEVPRVQASAFGVMQVSSNGMVESFIEKPLNPAALPHDPNLSLASMGIYVFNAKFLYEELKRDMADPCSAHDFGRDILPDLVRRNLVAAHSFERSCVTSDPHAERYWRDVGTVDSYWSANIDLIGVTPSLDLYDSEWPIWTYQEQLPPAKFVFDDPDRRGIATNSIVSGGCIISGSTVRGSLLFSKCILHSYSYIKDSVLLPEVTVGQYARLSRVIVDRHCQIPNGMVVGEDPIFDAQRFYRTENGITLITRETLAQLGY